MHIALSFLPTADQDRRAMLNSIFDAATKRKHRSEMSEEPLEDWYLEGLEVLEKSKRISELKKRMQKRATQQWGFYLELLMIVVWIGLGFWRVSLGAESLLSVGIYGLMFLTFLIRLIERIENASVERMEAALELVRVMTSPKAADRPPL